MPLPKSPLGKALAFVALLAFAGFLGALLGHYKVSQEKLEFGCLIPVALYVGIQLKSGLLVIGRSWNTVVATRDKNPRIYWAVLAVEIGLFLLIFYGLLKGTRTQQ